MSNEEKELKKLQERAREHGDAQQKLKDQIARDKARGTETSEDIKNLQKIAGKAWEKKKQPKPLMIEKVVLFLQGDIQ